MAKERPRGTCGYCERRVYLTRGGKVAAHWVTNRHTLGARVKCAGSGDAPQEEKHGR